MTRGDMLRLWLTAVGVSGITYAACGLLTLRFANDVGIGLGVSLAALIGYGAVELVDR